MRIVVRCCSLLLCVAICVVLFSSSAYAARIEQWVYNGNVFPKLPTSDFKYQAIGSISGDIYLMLSTVPIGINFVSLLVFQTSDNSICFQLIDNQWVEVLFDSSHFLAYKWSNTNMVDYAGNIIYKGSPAYVRYIDDPVSYADLQPVVGSFENQISVPMVIGILVGLAGVSVVLVFMWWGVRKVSGSLMKAFKKGKIRI